MTATIDLGTVNRDLATGQFQKTYTLAYETIDKRTGQPVKVVRHLPVKGIEIVGRTVAKAADKGIVWGVYVLDGNGSEYDPERDVTADFECFQD